jgi:hypothetical protein
MPTELQKKIAQWMADHPNDVPCPPSSGSARNAWCKARGLLPSPKDAAKLAEYQAIMAAKRAAGLTR